jgi:hypothetical protein
MAPFWIFGGRSITLEKFVKGKDIGQNIKQSLTVSLATTTKSDTIADVEYRKVSFGVKFSILRGNIKGDFEKEVRNLKSLLDKRKELITVIEEDPQYKALESKMLEAAKKGDEKTKEFYDDLMEKYLEEKEELLINSQKTKVENTEFKRSGFNLDLAFGLGVDFPTNEMSYSKVSKFGAWLTGDWYISEQMNFLLVSRILAAPNLYDSNNVKKSLVNFDAGAKLVLENFKKFSVSGEVIYRTYIQKLNDEEGKIRYTLNLAYELFPNKILTFNIGKDFDKNAETGGNIIAALNFILGFGSLKSL